jgi:hypothetical protein
MTDEERIAKLEFDIANLRTQIEDQRKWHDDLEHLIREGLYRATGDAQYMAVYESEIEMQPQTIKVSGTPPAPAQPAT